MSVPGKYKDLPVAEDRLAPKVKDQPLGRYVLQVAQGFAHPVQLLTRSEEVLVWRPPKGTRQKSGILLGERRIGVIRFPVGGDRY
jgi:hypothetical protein